MSWAAKTVIQKYISVHKEHCTQARKSYFLRFFNKSLLPVVLLEVKKSNPWQQIQLFKYKFVGPGGMLCNSNNVMKKDKSNYIIHGRKKHLKIFILPWSDWQMCVGDAAEILAHAGEQTAVIYCHIEKNNPAID